MTLRIAFLQHDRKLGRLTVSLDTDLDPDRLRLRIDGVNQPGKFIDTNWVGTLYQHNDGQWGLPGLGYGFGAYRASILFTTEPVVFGVTDPPPTLGTERLFPPERLLPLLWDAGFRTERGLLDVFAIACGESGFFTRARNWLPSQGFRQSFEIIGVEGPAAAWNKDHTQQGHSDRGLFQFNSRWHPDLTDAMTDDPAEACRAVWRKSNGGIALGIWGHGAGASFYSKFWDAPAAGFPALRPLVQSYLATKDGN